MQDIEELMNSECIDDIEKCQIENAAEELLEQVKCENCLYASQCDGYEYAPYCMA